MFHPQDTFRSIHHRRRTTHRYLSKVSSFWHQAIENPSEDPAVPKDLYNSIEWETV